MDEDLKFATIEEAQAAADADVAKRGGEEATGKRFVLGWTEMNGWTEIEGGEEYEAFGVTDASGEQMMDRNGEWWTVA